MRLSKLCLNKGNQKLTSLSRNCFGSQQVPLPFLADSIKEVTIVKYLAEVGDYVQQDDPVLEVESHKGAAKIRTPVAGKILKHLIEPEEDANIGANILEIDPDAAPTANAAPKAETPAPKKEEAKEATQPKKEEAKKASQPKKEEAPAQSAPKKAESVPQKPASSQASSTGFTRTETKEKMSRLRKTVSERLKDSQNTNAHVSTMNELDMSEIMKIRKDIGEEFLKKNGIKLGFMSFFVKAVTRALLERPMVNSVISGKEILHRNYVDISVAVSSPKGLVVPVLRNTQNMSFADIERRLVELAKKASDGSLEIEEMEGGTFTISNGGVFGSMLSVPIINPPQSAILGMHNIVNRPVVRGDQIVARPIMYLSMSYDHRLLDGREGAGFVKRICELLEDPRRLLLEF